MLWGITSSDSVSGHIAWGRPLAMVQVGGTVVQ